MNLYEQISYKGHHINVYYDEDALDPRQEFDHLGTLYTAHRHYQPEKDFHANFKINKVFEGRIGDFRDSFLKQYVALPVYLYEHGGATIATSPFSCPWDSGFFWHHRRFSGKNTEGVWLETRYENSPEAD